MSKQIIKKEESHDHFWIENKCLCESYKTIRGLRWRFITEVDYPDCDNLSDDQITEIKLILES